MYYPNDISYYTSTRTILNDVLRTYRMRVTIILGIPLLVFLLSIVLFASRW